MKIGSYVLVAVLSMIVGILLYALHKHIIIVQLPTLSREHTTAEHEPQKNVLIYYWHHGSWKHEKVPIIATDNRANTIAYIVTHWLNILEQSAGLKQHIRLEQVMLCPSSSDMYLSFDETLFDKNESTFEKWVRVEGLLKTLRNAQLGIARVYILVHHKPLIDDHIDFSFPWPVQGFLE